MASQNPEDSNFQSPSLKISHVKSTLIISGYPTCFGKGYLYKLPKVITVRKRSKRLIKLNDVLTLRCAGRSNSRPCPSSLRNSRRNITIPQGWRRIHDSWSDWPGSDAAASPGCLLHCRPLPTATTLGDCDLWT
jgi:hypothetical protein